MNSVLIRKPGAGNSEKPGPPAFPVCVRFPGNPLISVLMRKPSAGHFEKSGPAGVTVRALLPAKPLFSVSGREPRAGSFKVGGPAAGTVRARLPASPLFSVFGREPRAEDFGVGGPAAAMVRARLPAFGFRARTSGRGFRGWRPGGHHGSRSSPRFRFSGANLGPGISGLEARRFFPGAVCSPLPASPFGSVSGSKIFTHFPRRRRGPAHKKAPCRFIRQGAFLSPTVCLRAA